MVKGGLNVKGLRLGVLYFFRTINHIFKGYEPHKGGLETARNGALISMTDGRTSAYAMAPLQARGVMFIQPQIQGILNDASHAPVKINDSYSVYPGMVIGESSKAQDLYVNPCLKKQLTNIRAAGADEKIVLNSPRTMTLEECLAYMSDDEIVEVTPENIRLRKAVLDPKKRMAMTKAAPKKK